jgi:Peptidase M30
MKRTIKLGGLGKCAVALVLLAGIAACGGGGDSRTVPSMLPATPGDPNGISSSSGSSSASSSFGPVTPAPGPSTASFVVPQCTSCSAVSATQFSGSGTGVWSVTNSGTALEQVPVSISGLKGQTVQLVFSNLSAGTADSTSLSTLLPASGGATANAQIKHSPTAADASMAAITEFNHSGIAALLQPRVAGGGAVAKTVVTPPNSFALNSARQWYDKDGTVRNTTLVRQGTTGDGTIVDLWVEDSENVSGKVTPAIEDSLFSNYTRTGGVYDILTSIGGPLWGPQTRYNNVIPSNQPINLVVLNFDHNQQPGGVVGYFYSLNNLIPNSTATAALSNGAIALFLDSETMYLGGAAGMTSITTVMAHESTHMQNFYRRDMLAGVTFAYDTWLEEQTAMMMEDWASLNLSTTYNNVRDLRAPDYIQEGSYNCSAINFDVASATCDSYSVNGAFGGFLNRQLGLAFYKDLLYRVDSVDSPTILNESIMAANPSTSFVDAFKRFSVTMGALIPATNAPAGYNFPARAEGGFTLPAIDPSTFTSLLTTAAGTVTTSAPTTINAFATIPITRAKGSGTYSDDVPVPPGVAVSVVIY